MFFLKTAILASTLAQIALSAPAVERRQSPHIVFSTKSLTIEDSNVGAEVSVSLAAAPASAATIYLDAPGLKLTDCSFKFTPSDWRTPRKVRLIGGGDGKTTSYTLNAQVFAPGSGSHLAKDTVAVSRKANPSAECYSHGDPHYKISRDRVSFTFLGRRPSSFRQTRGLAQTESPATPPLPSNTAPPSSR
ncbi:hypothetical protein BC829DRAFT_68154 [Chytridium lagenaria]|nr:hypothetical protein BC829DRAFT_68154 [Chytridium lagenaria]